MYASPAIKAQSLDGFNDSFQLVPPKCPPGAWRSEAFENGPMGLFENGGFNLPKWGGFNK